jgi:hypothetical protein
MKPSRFLVLTLALAVSMVFLPGASAYAAPPSPPASRLATINVDAHGYGQSALVTWDQAGVSSTPISHEVVIYRQLSGTWQAIPQTAYTSLGMSVSYAAPLRLATVSGLTTGIAYSFTVKAVDAWHVGAESARTQPLTAGAPSPSNATVSATAGNGSAIVSWVPPGGAVNHYLLLVYQAGKAVRYQDGILSTARSVAVNGLANGTQYFIELHTIANNRMMSVGTWVPVTPRAPVLPRAPDPVTDVLPVAGNGMATVSWLPAYDGGSSITSYIVAYSNNPYDVAAAIYPAAQGWMFSGGRWSTPVYGLTNGRTYTFYVFAINAVGISPAAVSNVITLATAPGQPRGVQAIAGIGQATVSWTVPVTDGGSPITKYVVTYSPNPNDVAAIVDLTTAQGQATGNGITYSTPVKGLTNGKSYTFYVFTVNAAGTSVPSGSSNTITLPTVPGVVRNLAVTPGDESVAVKWDVPSTDGGLPILSYQVTATDGVHAPIVANVSGTSVTLTGLTNGTGYIVTVVASNAVGFGSQTAAVAVPRNLPPTLSAPSALTVDHGDQVNATITVGNLEPSDHLTLTASGLPNGVTFTDKGNGVATLSGKAEVPAGTYLITFTVSDGHNSAVSQTMTLTVVREQAVVRPFSTAPFSVVLKKVGQTVAKSVTVRATVREATDPNGYADIGEAAAVTYTLTAVDTGKTYSGQADTLGGGVEGTLTTKYTFHNIPIGVYRLRISIGGNYYQGSADSMLMVSSPFTKGGVSGQGQVQVPGDNASAQFHINVKRLPNDKLSGDVLYLENHVDGHYMFTSSSITGLIVKPHRAYIQGVGTLNGVAGQRFVIMVIDHQGRGDRFGMRVISGTYTTVNDCTFGPVTVISGHATVLHK